MPPVSDLDSVRAALCGRLFVSAAAVASDDGDRRASGQPCRRRSGFPIRENVDDATPFQIADDCPVAVAALPGKVIDTDHARLIGWFNSTAPDNA